MNLSGRVVIGRKGKEATTATTTMEGMRITMSGEDEGWRSVVLRSKAEKGIRRAPAPSARLAFQASKP